MRNQSAHFLWGNRLLSFACEIEAYLCYKIVETRKIKSLLKLTRYGSSICRFSLYSSLLGTWNHVDRVCLCLNRNANLHKNSLFFMTPITGSLARKNSLFFSKRSTFCWQLNEYDERKITSHVFEWKIKKGRGCFIRLK